MIIELYERWHMGSQNTELKKKNYKLGSLTEGIIETRHTEK